MGGRIGLRSHVADQRKAATLRASIVSPSSHGAGKAAVGGGLLEEYKNSK